MTTWTISPPVLSCREEQSLAEEIQEEETEEPTIEEPTNEEPTIEEPGKDRDNNPQTTFFFFYPLQKDCSWKESQNQSK